MAPLKSISVYADTSVFDGVLDDEFKAPSKAFFDAIRTGRFILVTSELVRKEIKAAPQAVCQIFDELLPIVTIVEVTDEVIELQQAYLGAASVSERYATDAPHVALATMAGAAMIVSWNFRHIVNFQKIPKYNAVNELHGQSDIAIYSPLEVIEHDCEKL